jgi:hypothetical protein
LEGNAPGTIRALVEAMGEGGKGRDAGVPIRTR